MLPVIDAGSKHGDVVELLIFITMARAVRASCPHRSTAAALPVPLRVEALTWYRLKHNTTWYSAAAVRRFASPKRHSQL